MALRSTPRFAHLFNSLPLASLTRAGLAGVVALSATQGAAQTSEPAEPLSKPTDRLDVVLRAGGTFDLSADFDEGDVAVTRLNSGLDLIFKLPENVRFVLSADAEYSWYDFDGATGLLAGTDDPLDQTNSFGFGARIIAPIDDHWTALGGGRVRWAYEEDADVSDGLVAGGFAGASYRFDNGLTLGVAVVVASRLEDDARVFALPTIDWEINDQWNLRTTGPKLRLSYSPSDPLTWFAEAGWESREYRLDDRSLAPNGVLRDDRVAIELGAVWHATPTFELSAAVGVVAYNQYEFLDSTGSKISDEDTDAAMRLRLGATLRF